MRDNMSNIELVLNMLAEASTTEITKDKDAQGFEQKNNRLKPGEVLPKQPVKNWKILPVKR
ncbi:MAG TPA: hypothetical protein P5514_09015 [Bacteroidales bacterium]|nr:hypothetical protein [Bacteroidales bacterium]HRX97071.1 hypothetical protein [Bacteroidales bacterium]